MCWWLCWAPFSLSAIIELGNKFIVLLSERCETCDFKLFIMGCCFLARSCSPTKTSSFLRTFLHKTSNTKSHENCQIFSSKLERGWKQPQPPAVQRRVGCENFMTVANLLFMTVCHRHRVDAQNRTATWTESDGDHRRRGVSRLSRFVSDRVKSVLSYNLVYLVEFFLLCR